MMLSPEMIYEKLKGESNDKIIKEIRKFRRDIANAKKEIERFSISDSFEIVYPSPEVVISVTREYIEYAKKALKDNGGVYIPSLKELKEKEFDDNVENISEIRIIDGPTPGIAKTHVIELRDDGLYLHFLGEEGLFVKEDMSKFYEGLRNLHMGEWKRSYVPTDYSSYVLDGWAWEVQVIYKNGKILKWEGYVVFPYNYNELLYMVGLSEPDA